MPTSDDKSPLSTLIILTSSKIESKLLTAEEVSTIDAKIPPTISDSQDSHQLVDG